jgi:hypothetical protein
MVGGRAILLLAFGLASGALTACGEVIGLGEEPRRALTAEDCKLPPAQRDECTECVVDACCKESLACAADTECARAAETCLPNCWRGTCAFECPDPLEGKSKDLLLALILCGTPCERDCLPATDSACRALGDNCCEEIEPADAQRKVCVTKAIARDEAECRRVQGELEADGVCTPN